MTGQLSAGATINMVRPIPVQGNDFVAISAGEHFSIALKQDGSIVCWGRNNYVQDRAA